MGAAEVIAFEEVRARKQWTDFSVVLFRPTFMLFSEKNRMKVYTHQWLVGLLSPLLPLVELRTRGYPMVSGLKLAKVSYDATYSLKRSQEAILVLLRNGLCRKGCARPAKRLLCSSCAYGVWPF